MTTTPVAHLNFRGEARAALDFYAATFGGVATVTTYADAGMPADAPGADRVVWGQVLGADGFRVMAYDIPGAGPATAPTTRRENGVTLTESSFFLALQGATFDEASAHFDRLADGATIVEPFAASPWSAGFGMLTDRFGVTWVIDVARS